MNDEPVFPDYDVVTSEELDLLVARDRVQTDTAAEDAAAAEAAWQALTPDEREAAFRRAVRHVQGPVIVGPRDRLPGVGASATKIAKRRARAKKARASRKRNRVR